MQGTNTPRTETKHEYLGPPPADQELKRDAVRLRSTYGMRGEEIPEDEIENLRARTATLKKVKYNERISRYDNLRFTIGNEAILEVADAIRKQEPSPDVKIETRASALRVLFSDEDATTLRNSAFLSYATRHPLKNYSIGEILNLYKDASDTLRKKDVSLSPDISLGKVAGALYELGDYLRTRGFSIETQILFEQELTAQYKTEQKKEDPSVKEIAELQEQYENNLSKILLPFLEQLSNSGNISRSSADRIADAINQNSDPRAELQKMLSESSSALTRLDKPRRLDFRITQLGEWIANLQAERDEFAKTITRGRKGKLTPKEVEYNERIAVLETQKKQLSQEKQQLFKELETFPNPEGLSPIATPEERRALGNMVNNGMKYLVVLARMKKGIDLHDSLESAYARLGQEIIQGHDPFYVLQDMIAEGAISADVFKKLVPLSKEPKRTTLGEIPEKSAGLYAMELAKNEFSRSWNSKTLDELTQEYSRHTARINELWDTRSSLSFDQSTLFIPEILALLKASRYLSMLISARKKSGIPHPSRENFERLSLEQQLKPLAYGTLARTEPDRISQLSKEELEQVQRQFRKEQGKYGATNPLSARVEEFEEKSAEIALETNYGPKLPPPPTYKDITGKTLGEIGRMAWNKDERQVWNQIIGYKDTPLLNPAIRTMLYVLHTLQLRHTPHERQVLYPQPPIKKVSQSTIRTEQEPEDDDELTHELREPNMRFVRPGKIPKAERIGIEQEPTTRRPRYKRFGSEILRLGKRVPSNQEQLARLLQTPGKGILIPRLEQLANDKAIAPATLQIFIQGIKQGHSPVDIFSDLLAEGGKLSKREVEALQQFVKQEVTPDDLQDLLAAGLIDAKTFKNRIEKLQFEEIREKYKKLSIDDIKEQMYSLPEQIAALKREWTRWEISAFDIKKTDPHYDSNLAYYRKNAKEAKDKVHELGLQLLKDLSKKDLNKLLNLKVKEEKERKKFERKRPKPQEGEGKKEGKKKNKGKDKKGNEQETAVPEVFRDKKKR